MANAEKLTALEEADIYPVICSDLCGERSPIEVLRQVVTGGARIVQLREKDLPDSRLFDLACEFRRVSQGSGVLLIINDRPDIALACGADGVHLGQDDLPVKAVRMMAPDLMIGVSTHSLQEALQAREDGADYINVGPIFPTNTKEGLHNFLGPEAVSSIGQKAGIAFSVMGGIKLSNVHRVTSQGARMVAVVTAITQADDVEGAVRSFREHIRNCFAQVP